MLIKLLIEKFPRIALLYRNFRDTNALSEEPKRTKLGFKFIGNRAMEKGLFEAYETKLVKKIFPKVSTVINVGANIGYYVCYALANNKKVFAFEPVETNLKYLLRNIKANNKDKNCEIFPVALSNKAGINNLWGGGTSASLIKGWAGISEKYQTLVPCMTMDNVLGDRLKNTRVLVIVDIEGAENMMLEGAKKLLNMKPRPIWLIEITAETHQPKGTKINPYLLQTFKKFWDKGYQAITVDNHLRKVSKKEIINIVEKQIDTLGTHNFIFYEKKYNLQQYLKNS